ncbi:MAG TPA: hypothetical protein VFO19_23475 [Vicinamibacterales bacterium]|nr:hypothetical protein [Vicinamibacterales bacterium]
MLPGSPLPRALTTGVLTIGLGSIALTARGPERVEPFQGRETAYVAVADSRLEPVRGLTAADFVIRVDGLDREVVDVRPASDPVSIGLLFDTVSSDLQDLRGTVTGLAEALAKTSPNARLGLTLPQSPPIRFVKASQASSELVRQVTQLLGLKFSTIEGVGEAMRAMSEEITRRRALIAAVRVDPSSAHAASTETVASATKVANELHRGRTALWGIQIIPPTVARGTTMLEKFMDQVPRRSGGATESISTMTALEPMIIRYARLIEAQYIVTYTLPSPQSRELRVGIKRAGVRVYAPGWAQ